MSLQNDIAYHYDGSYEGFLCCVFRAVYEKEAPAEISYGEEIQLSLFRQIEIETDEEKAQRVAASITGLGPAAENLIKDVFCSCMSYRESALLAFLRFAYRTPHAAAQLAHPLVAPLLAAQKNLLHEGHLFKEFLRFSDNEGVLISIIEPKNFVLPYICSHFVSRYPREQFFIWDKTHRTALLSDYGKVHFFSLEDFTPPPVSKKEREMRQLWKQFYQTISIKARENPRCRMTHMPKRFWNHLPELCSDTDYESPCCADTVTESIKEKPATGSIPYPFLSEFSG